MRSHIVLDILVGRSVSFTKHTFKYGEESDDKECLPCDNKHLIHETEMKTKKKEYMNRFVR